MFVARSAPGRARFYFVSNKRDKPQMDLYEADADQRSIRKVAGSEGDVVGWLIDLDRKLGRRRRR